MSIFRITINVIIPRFNQFIIQMYLFWNLHTIALLDKLFNEHTFMRKNIRTSFINLKLYFVRVSKVF